MQHRTISGKISYTSTKPEWEARERGREWFAFTHHADGSTIMRARCEIEEPEPTVLRDIIYRLDADGRPLDLHVHLTLGDAFLGSGWMHADHEKQTVSCESHGPSIGRLSQEMPMGGGLDGFGTHPIVGDGYLTRCMDISQGPHLRQVRVFLPSPDHRGASPPMIAEVNIGLEYVGKEEVTVTAGSFACRHFRFVDEAGMGGKEHPPYDMWVTADDDAIVVKGSIDGYMMNRYELLELERF